MATELKNLTAVLNPRLGLLDLVFNDGAVVSIGFLGVREVRYPHSENSEGQRNGHYDRNENCPGCKRIS
jgi:hypothetical protein